MTANNTKIEASADKVNSARDVFLRARSPIQELIKQVLIEERQVQHLKKKTDIHVKFYEHIRRIIQ